MNDQAIAEQETKDAAVERQLLDAEKLDVGDEPLADRINGAGILEE